MLNKIFGIVLFVFGLILAYGAVFSSHRDAWPIIWRLGLALVFIVGAVALVNVETVSNNNDVDMDGY
jgi:K+-transporting ATPase A subunit